MVFNLRFLIQLLLPLKILEKLVVFLNIELFLLQIPVVMADSLFRLAQVGFFLVDFLVQILDALFVPLFILFKLVQKPYVKAEKLTLSSLYRIAEFPASIPRTARSLSRCYRIKSCFIDEGRNFLFLNFRGFVGLICSLRREAEIVNGINTSIFFDWRII